MRQHHVEIDHLLPRRDELTISRGSPYCLCSAVSLQPAPAGPEFAADGPAPPWLPPPASPALFSLSIPSSPPTFNFFLPSWSQNPVTRGLAIESLPFPKDHTAYFGPKGCTIRKPARRERKGRNVAGERCGVRRDILIGRAFNDAIVRYVAWPLLNDLRRLNLAAVNP